MSVARVQWLLALLAIVLMGLVWLSRPAQPPPSSGEASLPVTATPATPGLTVQAALEAGDLAAARRLAERGLAAHPEDSEARRLLSEVEYAAGNYEKAMAEAEEALRLDPASAQAQLQVVRTLTFTSPAKAEKMARQMVEERPGNEGHRILLADTVLYGAAASGADPAAAAREAREILEPARRRLGAEMEGDYLAVLGNSYLMEGNLEEARKAYEAALERGAGMSDRVTDLASALAWVAFRQGDEATVGRAFGQALEVLANPGPADAFMLLPKWEAFSLMRLAFAGVPVDSSEMSRLDTMYERLSRKGYVDLTGFRADRELHRALLDAWERKDYGQAVYVLGDQLLPPEAETRDIGTVDLQDGDARLEPNCFYKTTVAAPQHALLGPTFLGMLAARSDRPALARYWYGRALELEPGNPILEKRLAALPPSGAPPADFGMPDPAGTLRILDRLAGRGWSSVALGGLEALQRQGVTQAQFAAMKDSRDPRYARVLEVLDGAVQALDRGTAVPSGKVSRPAGRQTDHEPKWWADAEATLDYGGSRPLVLHRENHRWVVSGFAEGAE